MPTLITFPIHIAYYQIMRGLQDLLIDDLLLEILYKHPQGITEYDLMQLLQERGQIPVLENAFSSQLNMFRAHFVLFNALYQLRDQLWHDEIAHLDITSIMITLGPYLQGDSGIVLHDPLREYYLNLDNLELTSAQDVEDLLSAFWIKFNAQSERLQALAILELEENVDLQTIRSQYKRLAMQHHPDRGGDKHTLQKINAAKDFLVKHHQTIARKILD
jgi:DnaJ-domain-containing protein 1